MASRHSDELSADFRRLYGVDDWHQVRPLTAASWCAVMIQQAESWTHRAINPQWRWSDPVAVAQATGVDYLALLTWFKTEDGTKGRNRPRPFPRPGAEGWHTPGGGGVSPQEAVALPVDELDALLARARTT